jgi:hypothetical protein
VTVIRNTILDALADQFRVSDRVAASGPEHLDTVPSYYTTDYQLTHAYTGYELG